MSESTGNKGMSNEICECGHEKERHTIEPPHLCNECLCTGFTFTARPDEGDKIMDDATINRAVHQALGECVSTSFTKKSEPFVGNVHLCDECGGRLYTHADPIPDYCTGLHAAMKFAEKLIEQGWEVTIRGMKDAEWFAQCVSDGVELHDMTICDAVADSPSKAICLAGLKALSERKSEDK